MQQKFPQPHRHVLPNWLLNSLDTVYLSSLKPKQIAASYFRRYAIGSVNFKYDKFFTVESTNNDDRMIQEVGRLTNDPIFVMGLYNDGGTLIGKGIFFNSSFFKRDFF